MRALLAAGLVLLLALGAVAPHDHGGPPSSEGCAACVLRNADVPLDVVPDLGSAATPAGAPVATPGFPPVSGAPLGAIPGQSPPAAA